MHGKSDSAAGAPARPAFRGLRLRPDEYEDLREEARGAVKAGMEMMARSVAVPGRFI
jgi:hypothetical protein